MAKLPGLKWFDCDTELNKLLRAISFVYYALLIASIHAYLQYFFNIDVKTTFQKSARNSHFGLEQSNS